MKGADPQVLAHLKQIRIPNPADLPMNMNLPPEEREILKPNSARSTMCNASRGRRSNRP